MLLAQGCQKDEPAAPGARWAHTAGVAKTTDPAAYLTVLKTIQSLILSISDETAFRAVVENMVRDKFDEDSEVLLRDLCSVYFSNTEITDALSDVEALLDEFEDIDGRHYYPQLFIPYFDELVHAELLGTKPVVTVAFLEDLTGLPGGDSTVFQGKKLGASGTPKTVNNVDGFYARENEVWVFSLNERVHDDGSLRGNETSGTKALPINVQIDGLTIRTHKESWVSGASEIHIVGFRTYWNGLDPNSGLPAINVGLTWDGPEWEGAQIKKVSRDDVDNETAFEVNFPIVYGWQNTYFYTQPVVVGYAIFEFDPWPALERQADITLPSGTIRYAQFRSHDQLAYVKGRWMSNTDGGAYPPEAVGFSFSNWTIAVNLEDF